MEQHKQSQMPLTKNDGLSPMAIREGAPGYWRLLNGEGELSMRVIAWCGTVALGIANCWAVASFLHF